MLLQGGAGATAEAPARLAACGADMELVALARECLDVRRGAGRATPAPWRAGSRTTWKGPTNGAAPPNWGGAAALAHAAGEAPAAARDGPGRGGPDPLEFPRAAPR